MKDRFVLLLGVLAVLLTVAGAVMSPVSAEPPRFSVVAPGIAHAVFKVRPADAEPFSGHAFKIDLDVAELRLIPAGDPPLRRSVEQIVAPHPVVVAANASFFDKDGRTMGLAVDEGRVMALSNRRAWGALVIDGTQARIMLGADIRDPRDHRLIVQGLPRLVVGGRVLQLKPQVAERTAVCAAGNIVVLVVSTRVEATAFARFLADHPDRGGLECGDALNLDGGPSTQLVVKLPALTLSLPGGWGVPNALVVAPGKQ
ncbi:MAG: phosphodiester glycosidase family protein [Candidatus Rokuibacteriota bacterium]